MQWWDCSSLMHRRSQGGQRGHGSPKVLENIVILFFERRFSKQNSVIRLKSNILPPKKFPPLIFRLTTPLHSCLLLCQQRQVAKLASRFFYCWSLLPNNNLASNLQMFTSSYDSRRSACDCWMQTPLARVARLAFVLPNSWNLALKLFGMYSTSYIGLFSAF